MQIGVYDAGKPRTVGKWTPIDMSERYFERRGYATVDRPGMIYASKDFYDPVKDRRIMWSWAHGYPRQITNDTLPLEKHFSVLTLAREITWNPELQLLQFSPIEEQRLLRGRQLCNLSNQMIPAQQYRSLGKWPSSAGKQSEVELIFEVPSEDTTFGVVVMGGSDFGKQGSYIAVHYTTPADNVAPFAVNISVSVYGSVIEDFPVVEGKLWLLPTDKTLSVQVFVDQTVSEIYWQGGRQVVSAVTPPSEEGHMAVTSNKPIMLKSALAWAVNSPWVSEEEQLKIPRLDGQAVASLDVQTLV
jgi:sucrose-6-phosphate hydrolase SacC (GH32 family)